MNLTELQVELRSIEDRLSVLHKEIDKMKPKSEDERKADFATIDKLAAKESIRNDAILSMSDEIRKLFFKSLSYILISAEREIYARLLYLTRLSLGSGLRWKSEEIYKCGFEIEDLDEIVGELIEYKYTFLVEAFIVSIIKEPADEKTISVIADISKIFECDHEEIRVIAQVAKSKLTNNMNILLDIPVLPINRWMNQFRDYISEEWIISQRKECAAICTKKYKSTATNNNPEMAAILNVIMANVRENFEMTTSPYEIVERLQEGNIVKAGDTLCRCIQRKGGAEKSELNIGPSYSKTFKDIDNSGKKTDEDEIVVKSPCDGIVFYVNEKRHGDVKNMQDEYIVVYVVSYFDDYDKFTQWFNSGKSGA